MAPFGNAHQKGGGQGKLMGKSSVCGYWVNFQTILVGQNTHSYARLT